MILKYVCPDYRVKSLFDISAKLLKRNGYTKIVVDIDNTLLPRDKNLLIVCQAGTDGPVVAYYLRARGFRNVSFVMGGVIGWKLFQPALYGKYAGRNKQPLIEQKTDGV